MQVWYERGCAGVLTWGPNAASVRNGTIDPSPLQVVESGLVDGDCTELLQVQPDDDGNEPDVVPPPLTCID